VALITSTSTGDAVALALEGGPLEHAEAVLLVDDGEPEPPEAHPLLDERVRADDERYAAVRDAGDRIAPRLALDAAGEQPRLDAERREERRDGRQVLLGQELRRRHERGLAARLDRAERREQRHERLAAADVALEQATHGMRRREVLADLGERALLRGRRAERQRRTQRGREPRRGGNAVPGSRPAAVRRSARPSWRKKSSSKMSERCAVDVAPLSPWRSASSVGAWTVCSARPRSVRRWRDAIGGGSTLGTRSAKRDNRRLHEASHGAGVHGRRLSRTRGRCERGPWCPRRARAPRSRDGRCGGAAAERQVDAPVHHEPLPLAEAPPEPADLVEPHEHQERVGVAQPHLQYLAPAAARAPPSPWRRCRGGGLLARPERAERRGARRSS